MQNESILQAQNVRFRYDPEQPTYAVDGVSVDIRRGEFVAVLGANGCGKSTLAKHFNAILLPEAGTVLVEGMDTRNEDHLYDVRQKVGMVFQNPDNQIVATIVEEDVAFAPENLGVPPEEIRTRIDEAMKLAGIYEKREAAPYKLSGGQKQRVAIAGVIAMRPDCLVMDESTAMLDPHGRAQVMKTIRQLRAAGITIVSITHYMEEAAQADRVLVMSRGRIVMEGTPEQVFSQTERLHGYHLDVPQAAELRDELVKAGIPMPVKCHYPRRLRGGIIQAAEIKATSPKGKVRARPRPHEGRACRGIPFMGNRRSPPLISRRAEPPTAFPLGEATLTKNSHVCRNGTATGLYPAGKETTMSEIIRVENLSYIYNQGMPDATKALDDVSFTVEEGDFVGIIGSTGSGKSTLISHFNGLNRPTSGRVLVDGRDLWEQGADLRSFRFLVGLVMQYPEYQLFEETCARDIAYGPRNMGLDEAEVQRRVREAAAFVGLSDELLEKSPFELSGGQKRRVAIAGVMAMHPRVLVLDEPAAGLDPEGRDTILSQIRDYHEKTGITVLLVSHSMEDIAKYANRVLVMHRAKIAMYDTVENVFARAQELLELGLSVPQVTQIFLKLRQMGLDIPADVYTIPYAVKTIQKALAAKQGGGANA